MNDQWANAKVESKEFLEKNGDYKEPENKQNVKKEAKIEVQKTNPAPTAAKIEENPLDAELLKAPKKSSADKKPEKSPVETKKVQNTDKKQLPSQQTKIDQKLA